MYKHSNAGGGDPEGKGFFRSLYVQKANQTLQTPIVIDCGFIPEAITGRVYVVGYLVPLEWSSQTGSMITWPVDGSTAYYNYTSSVTVNGTILTYTPIVGGYSKPTYIEFVVFGRATS